MDATAKPVESKRDKFRRIANARAQRAIKAIRILANMGGHNRYAYEFGQAEVDILAEALTAEVTRLTTVMYPPGVQLDIEDLIKED